MSLSVHHRNCRSFEVHHRLRTSKREYKCLCVITSATDVFSLLSAWLVRGQDYTKTTEQMSKKRRWRRGLGPELVRILGTDLDEKKKEKENQAYLCGWYLAVSTPTVTALAEVQNVLC